MMDKPKTSAAQFITAVDIGKKQGLNYIYAGNMPGSVGEYENTICHNCQSSLITRRGYLIMKYRITAEGTCPDCDIKIPGVWTEHPERINTAGPGFSRMI